MSKIKLSTAREGHTGNMEKLNKILPLGWFVASEKEALELKNELDKEMSEEHLLYGKSIKVIAHRDGATDDILCQDENDLAHFTVIHLTWSGKKEKTKDFPFIEIDGNFDDFLRYENNFQQKGINQNNV
jgi:hypothetical protein